MVQNELYNFRHLNTPTDQLFNINCIFTYDTYDFVIVGHMSTVKYCNIKCK